MPAVGWQLLVLHAITGVCTPVCLSAAIISVEAVTPPCGDMRQILARLLPYKAPEGTAEEHRKGSAVKEPLPLLQLG